MASRFRIRLPLRSPANSLLCLLFSVAFLITNQGGLLVADAEAADVELYEWKQVPIGGGGYVTGMAIHPAEPDLVYIRTDVGGAYRWDSGSEAWIPLLDMYDRRYSSYYSVDAIGVDPRDPDVVYVAVGRRKESPSAILKSTDRGTTWTETDINVGIYGNADYRWAGPRLTVDPRTGEVYFGSREHGLWRSDPTGTKFARIESFPAVGTGSGNERDGVDAVGITFVMLDPSSGSDAEGRTSRIYVGVFGSDREGTPLHGGVYGSVDGGTTWFRLEGSPIQPVRAAVDPLGTLYVTHTSGVAKCDATGCTDVTPAPGAYSGVTIDPFDPSHVLVAERIGRSGNRIFRSTDAGTRWQEVRSGLREPEPPWWPDGFFASAIATVTFDPHYANRVWFTDWFGTWRTDDITQARPNWRSLENGHEEVVVHTLASSAAGAPLFSGVAYVAGFRHGTLDAYPTRADRLPHDQSGDGVQDINSIAVYEDDPNYVYMVGNIRRNETGKAYRSTDNGQTWQVINPVLVPSLPDDTAGGRIAVSGTDPDRIVWLPMNKLPYFSSDGGRTWHETTGITYSQIVPDFWNPSISLASNTTGTQMFYVYHPRAGFFRSSDGMRFEAVERSVLPPSNASYFFLRAAPGLDGEVWLSLETQGLYRSSDYGSTFIKVADVLEARLFAFGKGKPGSPWPAAYILGRVRGESEEGIFRSDDGGSSWIRINDPRVLFGSGAKILEGDRQVHGRVYVGTSGRGIYVGEPAGTYGELVVGGKSVRLSLARQSYEVELPFGTQEVPEVELVRVETGPFGPAGTEAAEASLEVSLPQSVPGTAVVRLLGPDGSALHTARVALRARTVPDLQASVAGMPLPSGSTDRLTLQGTVSVHITTDAPAELVRSVSVALAPVRFAEVVHDERRQVYHGATLPDAVKLDTRDFDDGAYDLTVRLETVTGSWAERTGRVVLDKTLGYPGCRTMTAYGCSGLLRGAFPFPPRAITRSTCGNCLSTWCRPKWQLPSIVTSVGWADSTEICRCTLTSRKTPFSSGTSNHSIRPTASTA